ncbi:MAG: heat-inducible transcriptional repressor HrcA [Clostridia bacterium]|jgi:heat-inducible transcriptional repressor|nr:heat-inducible transcriptional repressor HrcA [Clostridia bacterium]
MSLDERKLKILQAIINDYIATAEPVGSRTIAKKYDLGVSSATIRNEMSDLEEMGFIIQPHASAGRIPSDMGYRLYVDNIMKRHKLGEREKRLAVSLISKNINQIQYLMDETARLISKLTNYATIFSDPIVKNTRIQKIQLMSLEGNKLMILIATDGNIVKHKIVEVRYLPEDDRLYEISTVITEMLKNQLMENIDENCKDTLYQELTGYDEIVSLVFDTIEQFVASVEKEKFHISGTNNMLAYPEFSDVEKAKNLFQSLEKKDALSKLLSEPKNNNDVQIYIGNESGIEEMKDCSIITTTYEFGDNITGTIGILGPTRMNYSQVVSVLNGMVENIEDVLNNLHNKKGD